MLSTPLTRIAKSTGRRVREVRMVMKALQSPRHPILVHIVPVRRCNLACSYCNEYDDFSTPVPTAEMLRRIDLLAALKATSVHLSGGEPMLHPDLEMIIQRIRRHRMLAGLLRSTNLRSTDRIVRPNQAGLDYLQISLDNIESNKVSKKSLKVVDQKLRWLDKYAAFRVNSSTLL